MSVWGGFEEREGQHQRHRGEKQHVELEHLSDADPVDGHVGDVMQRDDCGADADEAEAVRRHYDDQGGDVVNHHRHILRAAAQHREQHCDGRLKVDRELGGVEEGERRAQ